MQTKPILSAGFSVVGIDNSAKMLKSATQQLSHLKETSIGHVQLVQADMRNFNLETIFPLCIIPFRAFLHNLTMDEQLQTLTQIHRHLEPGGMLAFDLFVPLYQVISASEWHDKIGEEELHPENSGVSIDIKIKHRKLNTVVAPFLDLSQ